MALQKPKLPNNTMAPLTNQLDGVSPLWYSFFNLVAKNFQELIDDTGCVQLPVFSDTTRPTAGIAGRVIFNSTSATIQFDNGSAWTAV